MKSEMRAVLGRSVLGFTLSWAMACGEVSQAPGEEDASSQEQSSQPQTDVCAGAQGIGTYKGYLCPSNNFAVTENLSCEEARQNCVRDSNANPGKSVFCSWNDRILSRRDVSAGACDPLVCQAVTGLGAYKVYLCPSSNTVSIQLSSCQAARANCEFNANANSKSSLYCTWKGTEIFRRETIAGNCPR